MIRLLSIFFCFLQIVLHAQSLSDTTQRVCKWDKKPDPDRLREVYVQAFQKAYDPIPLKVLRQPTRDAMTKYLTDGIDATYSCLELFPDTFRCITVYEKNQAVGFLIIDTKNVPEEIYLAQLVVDPNAQRKGIGKELIDFLFHEFPEVHRFTLVTRIANESARKFYTSLGFKTSRYMHDGYSPELFIGFEYERATPSK